MITAIFRINKMSLGGKWSPPAECEYREIIWDPSAMGLLHQRREAHAIIIRGQKVVAAGWYCCHDRQYGCAYLGTCTAKPPEEIILGSLDDFPSVPYPGKGKWVHSAWPDGSPC